MARDPGARLPGVDRELRAMQELCAHIWTPGSQWHIGGLAWARTQHAGREWPTMVWLDQANRTAEIEPAGTAPADRRRGLARAVCLAALRAAREAGAESAVVTPRGDDGHPIPARLYRSLGFRERGRSVLFRAGT
ncbi:GNAT family N-acetyltransferase [Sinosporangium siamense]|uniref:N-acetyltransferase domain-containing protein n=1 Tax=Sinosporangium siamense TaxID=1367973 RepID=A0A919RPQ4_9ACTN|nr:GNAT family N-acetyltransferase [Sinosporangium siamense]GII97463.1 hypothetical protein Ssi02_76940 [Sinosporangium siamense]